MQVKLVAEAEPTPHHQSDEREQVHGRRASTVSCVRCPRCKSLLHVGNIVQRRYRARLVKQGRCVTCTKQNPDTSFKTCPRCRRESSRRGKVYYGRKKATK